MRYTLEIYTPDSEGDLWVKFDSDVPFGAMSAGDVIRPVAFDEQAGPEFTFMISRIEHVV